MLQFQRRGDGADVIQGLSYGEEAIKTITNGSALKRETDMQDCANTFVMLAKNTSMTGQEVIVDSGLEVAGR